MKKQKRHYFYSAAALFQRTAEAEKIADLDVLEFVYSSADGLADDADLLKALYPTVKPSRLTKTQKDIVYIAFDRVNKKGFIKPLLYLKEFQTYKQWASRWGLTDSGRHLVMTRDTGKVSRDVLAEIEEGEVPCDRS